MKPWMIVFTLLSAGCATQHPLQGMIPKDAVAVVGSSDLKGLGEAYSLSIKPWALGLQGQRDLQETLMGFLGSQGLPVETIVLDKPWACALESISARSFLGKDPWLVRFYVPVNNPWPESVRKALNDRGLGSWYEKGYEILTNAFDPGAKIAFPLEGSLNPDLWTSLEPGTSVGFYGNFEALGKALGLPFQMLPSLVQRAVDTQMSGTNTPAEVKAFFVRWAQSLGEAIRDVTTLQGSLTFKPTHLEFKTQVHFKPQSLGEQAMGPLAKPTPVSLEWKDLLYQDAQVALGINLPETASQEFLELFNKFVDQAPAAMKVTQEFKDLVKEWKVLQVFGLMSGPGLWYQPDRPGLSQFLWIAHPQAARLLALNETMSASNDQDFKYSVLQGGVAFEQRTRTSPSYIKISDPLLNRIPPDAFFFSGFSLGTLEEQPQFWTAYLKSTGTQLEIGMDLDWDGLQGIFNTWIKESSRDH